MTPQLRFPEFTNDWQSKKLGDLLVSVSSGKSITKTDGSEYLIYGSTGEIGSSRSFDYCGDKLLIARVGANAGSMYRVSGKYKVSDNTLIINLNADIETSFMQYSLTKFNLNRLVFGSGQPLVTGGLLKKISVSLPKLEEQEKISDFLTAVDDKITALDKKVKLLKKYKKGVMWQIFNQQVRFKDENGQAYPEWRVRPLKDISDRVTGKNRDNSITAVLTNSAVQGIVNQNEFFSKDIANQGNLLNYYVVSTDDFIYNPRISEHAPVGPIKRNHIGTGVMSPLYSVFRLTSGVLDFYEKYFETKLWHEYMKSVANSGARHDRMNITNADLYDLPLPFPVIEEQQKIATFLAVLDDKITAEQNRLSAAKEWKKGLMQRMFT